MKKTVLSLVVLLAFAQAASANCTQGRITTDPEQGGAVLVDSSGNPIGSIPNPAGLSPEETGSFSYSYIQTPNQEEITLLQNVTLVRSCQ